MDNYLHLVGAIYQKTPAEIKVEEEEQRSAGFYLGSHDRGVYKRICPTYMKTVDGKRVDTNELSERQILNIIEGDAKEAVKPQGRYANGKVKMFSWSLLNALDRWEPSCKAVYNLRTMAEQYSPYLDDFVAAADRGNVWSKARMIAEFQKQSRGDFSLVKSNDIFPVLEQMVINEQKRNEINQQRKMAAQNAMGK